MIVVIIGFTGMGKSTLAYHVAKSSDTVVIFDPRGQFEPYGAVVVSSAADLYNLLDEETEIVVKPGRGKVVEDYFDETCRAVANWIEDNPYERICLLVDEGRLTGLESKNGSLHFDWILRSAREDSNINVIITCHRPVDVNTNIRAISNRLIFFHVMLPNDLEVIEEQCGPVVSEDVKKLLDREFVTWNNSRQQSRKVTDTASWHIRIKENARDNQAIAV